LGSYSIKASFKNGNKNIEITEIRSMEYKGRKNSLLKIELKSVVICKNNDLFNLVKGEAETKINGNDSMKGSVVFSEKSFSFEGKGFLSKRFEVLTQPFDFESKDVPNPQGVLVIISAVPALGPKLLTKEGELLNIAFGEFPDEFKAPALIMFKLGYRLVRNKANENGDFEINLYSANSTESIYCIQYNKENKIVSMENFGKYKYVEEVKK
jgi:hypothetical protein